MGEKSEMDQYGAFQYEIDITYKMYLEVLQSAHIGPEYREQCEGVWNALTRCSASFKQNVYVFYQMVSAKQEMVLLSLGDIYDKQIEWYESVDAIFNAYIVEIFALEVLKTAYRAFSDAHNEKIGLYTEGMRFLDVDDLASIKEMIERQNISQIKMNEADLFIPQKTVAFFTKVTNQKTDACMNVCDSCEHPCELKK